MNVADKVLDRIDSRENPSVVGLDPRFNLIPEFIRESMQERYGNSLKAVAESYLQLNKKIINLLSGIIGFIKPQSAFYEQAGLEGIRVLSETIKYAHLKNLLVILDAKRNDIGSTAIAYSKAYLADKSYSDITEIYFEPDMLTVTPYLGGDGIKPFIEDCEKYSKGIFVLVKTSNPSSKDFQDIVAGSKKVYEIVAEKVHEWGKSIIGERGYSAVGAVVGATYPSEAEQLREIMPNSIFLVPGFGKQGGTPESVIPCFNKDGYGALISSSRGITFPYSRTHISENEFEKRVVQAAIEMRDGIRKALIKHDISPW